MRMPSAFSIFIHVYENQRVPFLCHERGQIIGDLSHLPVRISDPKAELFVDRHCTGAVAAFSFPVLKMKKPPKGGFFTAVLNYEEG